MACQPLKVAVAWLFLCSTVQAYAGELISEAGITNRPVTEADAITMTQIGDRTYLDDFSKHSNVVQFSPDGRRFAFVVQKGDLKNDTVEFRLLVFNTADALKVHRPEVVATLDSSSNREAITQVKWLNDNDTLVFIGEQPGQQPQLYRASVTTKRLQQLTHSVTPVITYSISNCGDSFLYVADVSAGDQISRQMREQGFAVTDQQWTDMYVARKSDNDAQKEIFVKAAAENTPVSLGVFDIYPDPDAIQLQISPDGRHALVNILNATPPVQWTGYKTAFTRFDVPTGCASGAAVLCPEQYMLIDMAKKSIEPLIDAPMAITPNGQRGLFAWTRENSVLLVNTFLPLTTADANERSHRTKNVYVAEVLLPSRTIHVISESGTPIDAFSIVADPARDQFVTRSTEVTTNLLAFSKKAGAWKLAPLKPSDSASSAPISVTLDQGPNAPPKLVAHELRTGRQNVVLDLNPQFARLAFGHAEMFDWNSRSGDRQEGILYLPVGYVPGKRYPLILQTHGSIRDRFWIDGPFTTAFAAQALAGRGFVVLQMGFGNIYDKKSLDEVTKILGTAEEGPYFMDTMESAIDELDRRGLIDRDRVGMIGFSRTVYHVLYTLTHSDYHFAAAVIADGADFGYDNCVYAPVFQPTCEKINGGVPYGATLSNWGESSPTFRLDKIQAPVLLQAISAPIGEWEILDGLRWLKKPVEMENFYPEGAHVLVRPRQRLLSQGSAVDWFDFWLNGHEDPDPAKVAQYERWHKLRAEQTARGRDQKEGPSSSSPD